MIKNEDRVDQGGWMVMMQR